MHNHSNDVLALSVASFLAWETFVELISLQTATSSFHSWNELSLIMQTRKTSSFEHAIFIPLRKPS